MICLGLPAGQVWAIGLAPTLTITPATISRSLTAGEHAEQIITVTNAAVAAAQLQVRLSDYELADGGQVLRFSPPGSLPGSLRGIVDLAPTRFDLAAGQSQTVTVRIQVPERGALPRYQGAVLIGTAGVSDPDQSSETVTITGEVGTIIGVQVAEQSSPARAQWTWPLPNRQRTVVEGSLLLSLLLLAFLQGYRIRARRRRK